eukprot:UN06099
MLIYIHRERCMYNCTWFTSFNYNKIEILGI